MWALLVAICLVGPDGGPDYATCEHAVWHKEFRIEADCMAAANNRSLILAVHHLSMEWVIRKQALGARTWFECRRADGHA